MHRKGTSDLKSRIFARDNLEKAFKDVVSKKKKEERYQYLLDHEEDTLKDIIENPFVTGFYSIRQREDKSSGKTRTLMVSPFRDQVLQHAVMNVCHPFFERRFVRETCCAMKGRGPLYASKLLRKAVSEGGRHCVKFDIRHYYASIPHEPLKALVHRIFKDRYVLAFFDHIIGTCEKGLPLGNHTSQDLANLYLTQLDRFVKEKLKVEWYVRYNDDFALISPNKRRLNRSIAPVKAFLATLGLETHGNEQPRPIRPRIDDKGGFVDLGGWKVYRDCVIIRKRIWKRLRRGFLRQAQAPSPDRAKRNVSRLGYLKYSSSANAQRLYNKGMKATLQSVKGKQRQWSLTN